MSKKKLSYNMDIPLSNEKEKIYSTTGPKSTGTAKGINQEEAQEI